MGLPQLNGSIKTQEQALDNIFRKLSENISCISNPNNLR
jgi:hypothetical protein